MPHFNVCFGAKEQPIHTAEVIITGFECGDLCDGLMKAHEKNTPKFFYGKKVTISYRKVFVPEGIEWMDEIIKTKMAK